MIQRASRSRLVVGRGVGQLAAAVGVGAGAAVIVAACFGLAIHSAGYSRLEWKNRGSG
jgi:hypothetical protein